MFIHSVYFWQADGLTGDDVAQFESGLRSLTGIEGVRHGWVGTPADTARPIIDRSYTYALVLAFDDRAAHDAYQAHPVHDTFRETCAPFWREVRIYDAETAD